VLDYYEAQDDDIVAVLTELDPNQLLNDVAEDCALQARRRRLGLRVEFARLPPCRLDRRHFERIVRNMLAYAIGRVGSGEIGLRAMVRNDTLAVEVTDSGPTLSPTELAALFERPNKNGNHTAARGLGLFIARAMAEAAGGRVAAQFADGRRGLTLVAEFPLDPEFLKAREP